MCKKVYQKHKKNNDSKIGSRLRSCFQCDSVCMTDLCVNNTKEPRLILKQKKLASTWNQLTIVALHLKFIFSTGKEKMKQNMRTLAVLFKLFFLQQIAVLSNCFAQLTFVHWKKEKKSRQCPVIVACGEGYRHFGAKTSKSNNPTNEHTPTIVCWKVV